MSDKNIGSTARAVGIVRGGRVTKVNGRDASYSPVTGVLFAGGSSLAMAAAALFAVPVALGGATSAHAQAICTVDLLSTYDCAGTSGDSQVLTSVGDPIVLNLDATAAVDTSTAVGGTGGDAIAATATGIDGSVTIAQATDGLDIIGQDSGIVASSALASVTVTTAGDVTGIDGDGIFATVLSGDGDVTVNTAAVTGGDSGIVATADAGSVLVTSTGPVSGGTAYGILATNAASLDGDVTVVATDVDGEIDGIVATNNGGGDLSVTASGTVNGETGSGIVATNEGDDLTVDANIVSGEVRGISAVNNGTGSTTVTADGAVTANSGPAVFVTNVAASTDIDVSLASAEGATGAVVVNNGSGATDVSATGELVGTDQNGLVVIKNANAGDAASLDNDVTIDVNAVTGATNGVIAQNNGAGDLTVMADGAIVGEAGFGLVATNAASAEDLTVDVSDVTGTTFGIYADNSGSGALSISADSVMGDDAFGILAVNAASATDLDVDVVDASGTFGINAVNSGTGFTTVAASGDVTGTTGVGIRAANTAAANVATDADANVTVDANNVSGETIGIEAINNGTGDLVVMADGEVEGNTGLGISATNSALGNDLMIEANIVTGATTGILATNNGDGELSITATGDVTGETDRGIVALNSAAGTDLTLDVADVTGDTIGVFANNQGSGDLAITSSGMIMGTDGGVVALNGLTSADIMLDLTDVQSDGNAVSVFNNGTGMTSVMASGDITSEFGAGVRVYNTAAATDATDADANIMIDVNNVTAETTAIEAENLGTGDLVVMAEGDVTSATAMGIDAMNGVDGNDLMIEANNVTAATTGIMATNNGDGELSITATGDVNSETDRGIVALNSAAGTDLTLDVADVTGDTIGVFANNQGSGDLAITSSGMIMGTDGGVVALNGLTSADIMLDLTDVQSDGNAVSVFNNGTGMTSVMASGDITSEFGAGVRVYNTAAATDATDADANIMIDVNNVTAETTAIEAENLGTGDLVVMAEGDITSATAMAIDATNGVDGNDLMIEANNVTAATTGIMATNNGEGMTSVTTTGLVDGEQYGIVAVNTTSMAGITIDAEDVMGGVNAIWAESPMGGDIDITIGGDVSSMTGDAVLAVTTGADSMITIDNDGTISDNATGYAINAMGAMTTVNNTGTINGAVSLSAFDDVFNNEGTFNATGTTLFGAGNDMLDVDGTVNLDGTIDLGDGNDMVVVDGLLDVDGNLLLGAGNDMIRVEDTLDIAGNVDFGVGTDSLVNNGTVVVDGTRVLVGLETFTNDGLIDMVDGVANDSLTVPGNYVGTGGTLAVDINGTTNVADRLIVGGAATGTTVVDLNPIGTGNVGFNENIVIVDAGAGSVGTAFDVEDGFVEDGFLGVDVVFNPTTNDFSVVTGPSAAAFRTARIAAATSELWYRTTDAVAAHLATSRGALDRGFWINGYGIKSNYDDDVDYDGAFDRTYAVGFDQDFFGAQAGVDFGSTGTKFGITGGVMSSNVNFDGSADNVEFTTYNLGAYAAFNLGGLFANVLGKYDWIDGKVKAQGTGYNADIDGNAWGVRGEVGFRSGSDAFFFEPVASLEYQRTSFDDYTAFNTEVDFDKFEGLRGMAGLRLGTQSTIGNGNTLSIYGGAHAVHEFEGGNDVTLRLADTTFTTGVDKRDTYARGELGVSIAGANGVSGFMGGTADFGGGDYEAYGVKGGISFKF